MVQVVVVDVCVVDAVDDVDEHVVDDVVVVLDEVVVDIVDAVDDVDELVVVVLLVVVLAVLDVVDAVEAVLDVDELVLVVVVLDVVVVVVVHAFDPSGQPLWNIALSTSTVPPLRVSISNRKFSSSSVS